MIDFLRKLWEFVRPYRGRLLLGLMCGILFGLANGILIGAVKVVIQLVFEGKTDLHSQLDNAPKWIQPLSHRLAAIAPEMHAPAPDDRIGWLLVVSIIPAIMLLRNLLQYLSTYLTNWSAMHAIADIRTRLFAHLQNLSLGFFNRASTGDLIARTTNDTQVLYGIIGGSLASAVKDPVTIVCLIGYQLATNTTLTLISIVVFPICFVPIVVYGRKVRKSARAVQQYNAELTNLMHESFTGNCVIKAYNLEGTVIERFKATTKQYVGQMMRVVRANEIQQDSTADYRISLCLDPSPYATFDFAAHPPSVFEDQIRKILSHGDLADIDFLEKTLDLRFRVTRPVQSPYSNGDDHNLHVMVTPVFVPKTLKIQGLAYGSGTDAATNTSALTLEFVPAECPDITLWAARSKIPFQPGRQRAATL